MKTLLLTALVLTPLAEAQEPHTYSRSLSDTVPPPEERVDHEPGGGIPPAATPAPISANTGSPRRLPTLPATGSDPTTWSHWWAFNQHPYLNLKGQLHLGGTLTGSDDFYLGSGEQSQEEPSLRPKDRVVTDEVVPVLVRVLRSERSNDIVTGAMIALAKIGQERAGNFQIERELLPFLSHSSQEVSETAVIALGILADPGSIPTLVDLMKDDPLGRLLVGSTEVPTRMRSFAAFGLGLVAAGETDNDVRRDIAAHLIDILESPHFATRDIKVAAMTALGLTPVDVEPAQPAGFPVRQAIESRAAQLDYLLDYFEKQSQRANKYTRKSLVRAHAPTAIARLLTDEVDPEVKERAAELLLESIAPYSKSGQEVRQSAILALGQIGDADGNRRVRADAIDIRIRSELLRVVEKGLPQERRFAVIALSQIAGRAGTGDMPYAGTEALRKALVQTMARGRSGLKPWSALSLGVLGRARARDLLALDSETSRALRAACRDEKSPETIGAYCIGLGLRGDLESKSLILEKMKRFLGSHTACGDAAVALGLLHDRKAIPDLQAILRNSRFKPQLMESVATALGLLGDKALVVELVAMLKEAKGLATQSAIANALGSIGDARSIDALVSLLEDEDLTGAARGAAAIALGTVCDKETLPWDAKVSRNVNYRAVTATLVGGGRGILDVL